MQNIHDSLVPRSLMIIAGKEKGTALNCPLMLLVDYLGAVSVTISNFAASRGLLAVQGTPSSLHALKYSLTVLPSIPTRIFQRRIRSVPGRTLVASNLVAAALSLTPITMLGNGTVLASTFTAFSLTKFTITFYLSILGWGRSLNHYVYNSKL